MIKAAEDGDAVKVNNFLRQGADVNAVNEVIKYLIFNLC